LRSILGRGRDLSDEQLVELREHPSGRQVLGMLRRTLVGTGPEVVAGLDALAEEVRADELILVNAAVDEDQQHRTLELLAPQAGRGVRDEAPLVASAV
jgi:alkanesulfonate monooxygenase SsuD/methylene tetrahydromethanopterin reductase-like flavin-dependent oxidoreductase (luciferase family)